MSRIWARISVVWFFFVTEGRILDPHRDPALAGVETLASERLPPRRPEVELPRSRRSAPLVREERMDYLCEVFNEFQGGHAGHRHYFRRTGRLDTLDDHRLTDVDLSLDQRRFRTRTCCRKVRHHRYRCFDDYHIRRIDGFCGDGFPDIPFPAHTTEWHTNRQTQCCGLLAMDRIQCFRTTLQGAPEGEDRYDDLDPADDAPHYIEDSVVTVQPDVSSDIAVDHPSAYPSAQARGHGRIPSSSTTTTTTTTASRSRKTTASATVNVCCAAGNLVGLEVTSHKLRTCSRKARQVRRFFSGVNREMCETMARTCCLRVAMRSEDGEGESSMEDRLLASVMMATSATDPEGDVQDGRHDDGRGSDEDSRSGDEGERSGAGNSRWRGRTASPRRHSRYRSDRGSRRRGRRRNRDRA